jgi:hypothetical protein
MTASKRHGINLSRLADRSILGARRQEQVQDRPHRRSRMLPSRKRLLIAAAAFLVLTSATLLLFLSPLSLFSRPVAQPSPTLSDFCNRMHRASEVSKGEVIDSVSAPPATFQDDPSYGSPVAEIQLFTPGATPLPAAGTTGMKDGGKVDLFVTILSSTHIFRQVGSFNCATIQNASLRDLKPGQALQIWAYTPGIEASYPGQIPDTSDILILP